MSLAFTVLFWVVLLFKPLAYACIKRMQVGKAVICSAALFLASALLITFGPTLPLIIAGQCLYEIAPDFFGALDILLKGLCERDRKGRDYVQSSSFASTLYSVITLIAALLIDPLMSVNPYLPMTLCVVVRFFSLPLAIAIHVGTRKIEGLDQGRRVILKGRYFDKATMS
ncbi:MAG: hypothetical protein Q4A01_06455 [Coriobacteriales bacterium]|nr:hypothetical protein [Coriobacteriales bacterium]